MNRPIYIDIDGTLTDKPTRGGVPKPEMLAAVAKLANTRPVVLWTGGGQAYAQLFAEQHFKGVPFAAILGKPEFLVDDNPTIRPVARMPVLSPHEFLIKYGSA